MNAAYMQHGPNVHKNLKLYTTDFGDHKNLIY